MVKGRPIEIEYVKHAILRRHCISCKRQVSAKANGVVPNARVSSNYSAAAVSLGMSGLSHGKAAGLGAEAAGKETSRPHRNKIAASRWLAHKRDVIRCDVLDERYLTCGGMHRPLERESRYVPTALGRNSCPVEVSDGRGVDALKRFLPGYDGIVGRDSYTGWYHVSL